MDVDDLVEQSPFGIPVAVLAALLLSPRLRGLLRRGAVTALAGLVATSDSLAGWVRHIEGGRRTDGSADAAFVHELADEAHAELARRTPQAGQTEPAGGKMR
jgi:hypothetical protein